MSEITGLSGGNRIATYGALTASSNGTSVSTANAANTKGASWTEIAASTAFQCDLLIVEFNSASVSADWLIDIAIGGSGSEVVLISNIHHGSKANESGGSMQFQLSIPAGTRISAKAQSTNAVTANIRIVLHIVSRSFLHSPGLTCCTTYGASTADSGGAGVDPGGTINTKGGWTQIVASTTNPIKQLIVVLGDRNNSTSTTCSWLFDVGVGASTQEQTLIANLYTGAGTISDTIFPAVFGPFPVNIPAGTRISVNAQCSINDATDRLIDVVLYGLN